MIKFSALLLVIAVCVLNIQGGKLVKREAEDLEDLDDIESIHYQLRGMEAEEGEDSLAKRATSCTKSARNRCSRNGMNCNVWGGGFSCVW